MRKCLGWTQEELAERLGVGRSVIGSYEEGRAEPRSTVLLAMSRLFDCTLEDLLQQDGESGGWGPSLSSRAAGDSLRVLTVGVGDSDLKERISLVPEQAAAGYLQGHRDADYVARLPAFRLPVPELSAERTYRLFQIKGDSMLPVPDGSYVVAEFIPDWRSLRAGQCAVVFPVAMVWSTSAFIPPWIRITLNFDRIIRPISLTGFRWIRSWRFGERWAISRFDCRICPAAIR